MNTNPFNIILYISFLFFARCAQNILTIEQTTNENETWRTWMKNDSLAGALPSSNLWKLNFDEKQLNCENFFFQRETWLSLFFFAFYLLLTPQAWETGKKSFYVWFAAINFRRFFFSLPIASMIFRLSSCLGTLFMQSRFDFVCIMFVISNFKSST